MLLWILNLVNTSNNYSEKLLEMVKNHEKVGLEKEHEFMAAHLISHGYVVIPPKNNKE